MEDNWFDTAEALKKMDDATFEKMKIPLKLVQMMRIKLDSSQSKEKVVEPLKAEKEFEKKMEVEINVPKQKEKPKKIESKTENTMVNEEQLVFFLLNDLKAVTQNVENYRQTLTLIKTITKNIVSDPKNPNFRRIKLVNKKFLENISPFPPALDLLKKAKTQFF